MKKVFALLLTLCAVTFVFVACTEDEPPHEHTFDSTWLYDESQHWHAATCEHTDLVSDRGDHVDVDANDICDTCGYIKDHVHSFEEKWSWDEENHFHKSACGHNVKSDEKPHADDNNDALCDVCTYDYGHTHTYDEAWSANGESGHWHAPTCGHTVDGSELTPHADGNNDGDCDVCGFNGGHEHTYANEWTTTDDEHWREVTCGHDVPVANKGVHKTEDGDTTCDICGYTPEHFHTFADTLSSNSTHHWYASTCGHDVKKEEAPHGGHEEDGVCDVCSHVVFNLYTVTVTAPEYITVFAPDGRESSSFAVKENTPVSFTVSVPDFAEIVQILGAKQDGKPTTEGTSQTYRFTLDGLTGDHTVNITGNKLRIVETIVPDGQGSIAITGMLNYGDLTFRAPSAGRYMIFSTTHEEVSFGQTDENGTLQHSQVYFVDVTGPTEVPIRTYFFSWEPDAMESLEFSYVVAKVENEITLSTLKAEGYVLPTNADVTVHFTAPKAGRYQISSSTLGMVWNGYLCDSIVLTATEDNQEMSFVIEYRKTTSASFVFDCDIVSMEAAPIELGDNTVTAPYGSYYAITFTAPHDGSFLIQALSPYFDFYAWNDANSSMTIQGNSYTANNLNAGDKVNLFVTVDIYEYDGTDDITDVIRVVDLGYVPGLSGDSYVAKVGVNNSYISEYEASDFILSVGGGNQISVDGGKNWYTSVQVSAADFGTISYMVQSANGSDTVQVSVTRIEYEYTLHVGTQTQTMIPDKEYTVYLSGSADPAHYFNYVLNWTDPNVAVSYNGQVLASGATISNYSDGYALVIVYSGTETADIAFTLSDPYTGGSSSTPSGSNSLTLGSNSISVTVENNYCAGTTVTFVAPATGTYVLSPASGENNAEVTRNSESFSEILTLPYTFTAEKGETITFLVATTEYMSLTTDVIDLELERVPTGEILTSVINGIYNVNYLGMDGLYVLTFDDGDLTVVDNNKYTTTNYKYFYTEQDGVVVTHTTGTACDVVISIDDTLSMTFSCATQPTPQPLIKQNISQ